MLLLGVSHTRFKPDLAVHAREVAELVGLPGDGNWGDFVQVLGGNVVTPGMKPYAACYGGHQFGNWAGQLGDGRAITLGEAGADGQSWERSSRGLAPHLILGWAMVVL